MKSIAWPVKKSQPNRFEISVDRILTLLPPILMALCSLFVAPQAGGKAPNQVQIDGGLAKRILALDPDAVSAADVRETLARAPAPRIFLIHGGIPPSDAIMESFGEFLVEMGYPRREIENPRNRSLSYSPYASSAEMAGYMAWYYERAGMRPMIIGHSQGGMQTVRVLCELNGTFGRRLHVWNPATGKPEAREQIIDPLQHIPHSVVGLKVSYASALAAGGLARLNPSHWNMLGRLRTIPDTVDDFAGYHLVLDLLGGDLLGFGGMNDYKSGGSARVRNVRLPEEVGHFTAPVVRKLAENSESRDWINRYRPELSLDAQKPPPHDNGSIVYAAEVWYSVKRHWVLELQRLIKARNQLAN